MTAKELEMIQADVNVATKILYPSKSKGGNSCEISQSELNLAAYHSAQAIEKSLKAIIRNSGIDLSDENTKEMLKTHQIEALLLKTEMCKKGFISEHPYLLSNASSLSMANSLRYGTKEISKKDTIILYKETKDFLKELQQEYSKSGKDISALSKEAKQEYNVQGKKYTLNSSTSKYAHHQSNYHNDNKKFKEQCQSKFENEHPVKNKSESKQNSKENKNQKKVSDKSKNDIERD